jgi:hypothetical protein
VVECAGLENRQGQDPNTSKHATYENDAENLACFLARLDPKSADLAEVVRTWSALPDALHLAILAIVRTAKG